MSEELPLNEEVRTLAMTRRIDERQRALDAWIPPHTGIPFIHTSINYCDEMDTHNKILDYSAIVTGTAGAAGHPLGNIATHDFDTKWQADPGVAEDDQYFELEMSEAVEVDSYIMNFHVPYAYATAPYTPDMGCWKAWTLKGKLEVGDSWTTLETVSNNSIKFYRGSFTKGSYKYFRVEAITAYSDQSQSVRIDAYLYTMGLFDTAKKFFDAFPDSLRGRNDSDSIKEAAIYAKSFAYITAISFTIGDIYDLNGQITNLCWGLVAHQHRHLGGLMSELSRDSTLVHFPEHIKMSRLNSIDFVANSGLCLFMFPPPDEIWWFTNSGYAFDETTANMNVPIKLKIPDNAHKLSPSWTVTREYGSYAILGARYVNTRSGEYKTTKYYIVFSDPTNMESQIRFDGQESKGLITDMDGTALTGCANASSNVNVVRLKIGSIWRGWSGTVEFTPPIKLDCDDPTHLFEINKAEKIKGSVFRYVLHGFRVPKLEGE